MDGDIRVGEWLVQPQTGTITNGQDSFRIEPKAIEVLLLLAENRDRISSKEEIITTIWSDTFVTDDVVSHAIFQLRKAFGDDARSPTYIKTYPKRGYRLIAPMTSVGDSTEPSFEVEQAPEKASRLIQDGEVPSLWKRLQWKIVGGVLGIILLAFLFGSLLWRASTPSFNRSAPSPKPMPLTAYSNLEIQPRLSPDGSRVVFVRGNHWFRGNLWLQKVGSPVSESKQITTSGVDFSPIWSPEGDAIAFLRSVDPLRSSVMLLPSFGRKEQKLLEVQHARSPSGPSLAWSPDGKWLVISGFTESDEGAGLIAYSFQEARIQRMTRTPPPYQGDYCPVLSLEGTTLAFVRTVGDDLDSGALFTVDLDPNMLPAGKPRQLTDGSEQIAGITWSGDGNFIIYSAGVIPRLGLWRLGVWGDKLREPLEFAGLGVSHPHLSARGRRLVYERFLAEKDIQRLWLTSEGDAAGEPEDFASSSRWEEGPSFSPDGDQIAFISSRSGTRQLWICGKDGSGPRRLTSFGNTRIKKPRWSPDGKEIAFASHSRGAGEIYVVNTVDGLQRQLTDHPADDRTPTWSADGDYIFFSSNRNPGGIWKISAAGGKAVPTKGREIGKTDDGQWVFYSSEDQVWKVSEVNGDRIREPELKNTYDHVVRNHHIYSVALESSARLRPFTIRRFDMNSGKSKSLFKIEKQYGWGLAVSPDERVILYAVFDLSASDLMIVEDFR